MHIIRSFSPCKKGECVLLSQCSTCIVLGHFTTNYCMTGYIHSTKVGMTVAQEQFEAEDDVSFQQRLVMAAGTSAEGASEMMDNDIASGMYCMFLL